MDEACPDRRLLSAAEPSALRGFSQRGGKLILTGYADPEVARFAHAAVIGGSPGSTFLDAAKRDFEHALPDSQSAFLKAVGNDPKYGIKASPGMVAYVAEVNGKTHWYLANFKGLKQGDATAPEPVKDVVISAPAKVGRTLHLVPFLETEKMVQGTVKNGEVRFLIPEIDRAAIAWTNR